MVTLLSEFLKKIIIFCIKCYQQYISILLCPCCRFNPSCSKYALQILYNNNLIQSFWLILKRILKCQPLFVGGTDNIFVQHKSK